MDFELTETSNQIRIKIKSTDNLSKMQLTISGPYANKKFYPVLFFFLLISITSGLVLLSLLFGDPEENFGSALLINPITILIVVIGAFSAIVSIYEQHSNSNIETQLNQVFIIPQDNKLWEIINARLDKFINHKNQTILRIGLLRIFNSNAVESLKESNEFRLPLLTRNKIYSHDFNFEKKSILTIPAFLTFDLTIKPVFPPKIYLKYKLGKSDNFFHLLRKMEDKFPHLGIISQDYRYTFPDGELISLKGGYQDVERRIMTAGETDIDAEYLDSTESQIKYQNSFHPNKKQEFEENLAHYLLKTSSNEENAKNWTKRGFFEHLLFRYNRALESFNRAIQIDNKFDKVYLYKSYTLAAIKRYQEAFECADNISDNRSKMILRYLLRQAVMLEIENNLENLKTVVET